MNSLAGRPALLAAGLLAILLAAPGSAAGRIEPLQERAPAHGEKCPASCTACTTAIAKALDFIACRQTKEGCIPAQNMGLIYVKTDRNVTHVWTTALGGLAFLASGTTQTTGPYRTQIALARRFLQKSVDEILKASPRLAGGGGGPIYSVALSLQFFTHIYEREKDADAKRTIEALITYLAACVGDKVSRSCWQKGIDDGTVCYVSGVTALLNSTILALARARAAGFEVPDRVWNMAQDYYAKYWETNGSVKYDQDNMFPEEPRWGRSITALLALKAMGVDGKDAFKPAYKFARENIGRTMSHHTPSMHMTLCAHAFRAFGADDWKTYVATYHEKLIARQKEDGSLEKIWDYDATLMMTPNDTLLGATYATVNFALILQVPLGHVQFYVKKP